MGESEEREPRLREALRAVLDPEVGVNIVDLGLVYRLAAQAAAIEVELTMTSAACPLAEVVVEDARAALAQAAPGREIRIRLVWEPPWEPSMMSERARRTLGWE